MDENIKFDETLLNSMMLSKILKEHQSVCAKLGLQLTYAGDFKGGYIIKNYIESIDRFNKCQKELNCYLSERLNK